MKKILLALILSVVICAPAWAAPTAKTFRLQEGMGFAMDDNGDAYMDWGMGGDYFVIDNLSVGMFFDLFASGTMAFDIGGRGTYVFSGGAIPEVLEPFASLGIGYIHLEGGVDELIIPIDFGFYWFPEQLLNGRLGIGSRMGFNITTIDGSHFIWSWETASLTYKF